MFPRQQFPPTISLPLYNTPPGSRPHQRASRYALVRRNQLTRYMALGLLSFILLTTFFVLSGATPFLRRDEHANVSPTPIVVQGDSRNFRGQVQGITEIYRGKPPVLEGISHLILVTGHAILLDKNNYLNDDAWVLESFQRGQVQTFIDHIRNGVELAYQDPNSLLVFSGGGRGQTRQLAGPRSEGQSYWNLANHLYSPQTSMQKFLLERVVSEEFARDSYENLLFSICRFHELTGRYPDKITAVGFGFKARRFEDLHRKAIRFPKDKYFAPPTRFWFALTVRFVYVGIDPPGADLKELNRLEKANAAAHFEADPYACRSQVLAGKRLERNPFRRMHGYAETNPALLDLLNWCPEPGTQHRWFSEKRLPWELVKPGTHDKPVALAR